MNIHTIDQDDVTIFRIEGTYTKEARPDPSLEKLSAEKLASGCRKLVFDLEKAEIVSDVAMGDILAAFMRIHDSEGQLKLGRPSPGTLRLLRMTMLDKVLDIHDSIESALDSYSGR
jgi:anti-anti-sigma factor